MFGYKLITTLFLVCSVYDTNAQNTIIDTPGIEKPHYKNHQRRLPIFDNSRAIDLIDLGNGILNKFPDRTLDTVHIAHNQKLHSSLLPGLGYAIQTGGEIELSYLGGFYTSKQANENQSSLLATIIYTQKQQLLIPAVGNFWTNNNKYNIQTDWRFLVYPLTTYGLGGYSSLDKGYVLNYTNLRLYNSIYKVIRPDIYFGLGYDFDYYWNVHEVMPPSGNTDFLKYNQTNNLKPGSAIASAPTVSFLYDTRRNSINPEGGSFINLTYRLNRIEFGSSQNWQSLALDLRKYIQLSANKKQLLAFWAYEWLTIDGTPPYLELPNIGGDPYANTGRGFAEARFRGRNMLYLEGEYRFGILRNGLLGGVLFANTESFSEQTNDQFARVYAGYGAGIRIKFNKFSRTNVVFDYAFGTDGSKGLFLNLGEAF